MSWKANGPDSKLHRYIECNVASHQYEVQLYRDILYTRFHIIKSGNGYVFIHLNLSFIRWKYCQQQRDCLFSFAPNSLIELLI